jgi:hypothetical protein
MEEERKVPDDKFTKDEQRIIASEANYSAALFAQGIKDKGLHIHHTQYAKSQQLYSILEEARSDGAVQKKKKKMF